MSEFGAGIATGVAAMVLLNLAGNMLVCLCARLLNPRRFEEKPPADYYRTGGKNQQESE